MNSFFQTLAFTYLLYPILGLLLVGLGIFIAKKNALLGNKRLVGYTIGAIVILTIPALLGFLDYGFMPYGYVFLAMLYLILGGYNIRMMSWVYKDDYKYRREIILTGFILVVSMLFFTLVFNLCNELKYGLWASTCLLPFVIVSVFIRTYRIFIAIPIPVYEVWRYTDDTEQDGYFDPGSLQVLQIELYKQESDREPVKLSVKAPDEMQFGTWFHRMIDDYNLKSPQAPIDDYAAKEGGWIFYRKPSLISPRHYIDFNLTVKDNRILSRDVIVAKRVMEHSEK